MTRARGWIEERTGKRGTSYRVRWRAIDDDGVERVHSETVATEAEAARLLQIKLGEVASGIYRAPSKMTLAQLLDRYLAMKAPDLEPSSRSVYATGIRPFVRALGDVPLSRLTTPRLQAVITSLRAEYQPKTIHTGWTCIRAALRRAVQWGLIPTNPAIGVAMPGIPKPKQTVWTAAEAATFLAKEGNHPIYGLIWRLMIATGLRKGELAALRWDDVDLTRGELLIRRTAARGEHHERVLKETTKTHRHRSVAIPASLVAALTTHRTATAARRLAAPPGSPAADLVFVTRYGTPVDWQLSPALRRACERAGVPYPTARGLRHSYATIELSTGAHPRIVQQRLGHAKISMTLDTYSHVLPEIDRAAAERFDALIAEAEAAIRRANGE